VDVVSTRQCQSEFRGKRDQCQSQHSQAVALQDRQPVRSPLPKAPPDTGPIPSLQAIDLFVFFMPSHSRSRAPRGAPACVTGRSSPAIRRWARPQGAPSGAALPHQRLSAFCSLHFFQSRKQTRGTRPHNRAGAALAFRARPFSRTSRKTRTATEDSMDKSHESAPPLSAKQEACLRGWGNFIDLWRVCANTACGRARCCRGKPTNCFSENFSRLPEGVQDW
jgi:hypothetical protein